MAYIWHILSSVSEPSMTDTSKQMIQTLRHSKYNYNHHMTTNLFLNFLIPILFFVHLSIFMLSAAQAWQQMSIHLYP